MRKLNYDVVVVGAGPGGSTAARTCAKYGLKTLMIDKKSKIGRDIHVCGVNSRIFDYIKIDKRWADAEVRGVKDHSPDGTEIETHEPSGFELGYIVNRHILDEELAKIAVEGGSELFTKVRATGLIREDGKIRGIRAKVDEREDIEIRSNIVIGADGVGSRIGRCAGIYSGISYADTMNCVEVLMDDVDSDQDYIYNWYSFEELQTESGNTIYPHGGRKAGVGYYTFGPYVRRKNGAVDYLHRFIKKFSYHFSHAKIIDGPFFGIIPMVPTKQIFTDGIMLVGDAAGTANSLAMYGGVLPAMDSGELAGEVAVEAHEEGDFSGTFLSRYRERWMRSKGNKQMVDYLLRKWLESLPAKDYNETLRMFIGLVRDTDGLISDDILNKAISSKFMSKFVCKLKKEGFDEKELFSILSDFRKYYRSYWSIFIQ